MFVNSLLYRQLRRLPEILILDWFSTLCTDTPSPQEKSGEEATSPIFPEGKGGGGSVHMLLVFFLRIRF